MLTITNKTTLISERLLFLIVLIFKLRLEKREMSQRENNLRAEKKHKASNRSPTQRKHPAPRGGFQLASKQTRVLFQRKWTSHCNPKHINEPNLK